MGVEVTKLRVVVVDDHPLFREGVHRTLEEEADIEVVAEGHDGEEALRLAQDFLPDVILLDIAMPKGGGVRAAQAISVSCPATKIIMLTVSEDEDDLLASLKSGAQGYILKGLPARELANLIRAIHSGETYVTPGLATRLLLEWKDRGTPEKPGPLDELTDRERDILQLVSQGMTNREIGLRLGLSEKTVKHYMTNILQKLQVRSRVEAALLARKTGFESRP
ncbi:MAG: response regulator transcription factor [Chloroflexi bacterium]|nr:response regulator transcription factor [Chloroflexota bacterium]